MELGHGKPSGLATKVINRPLLTCCHFERPWVEGSQADTRDNLCTQCTQAYYISWHPRAHIFATIIQNGFIWIHSWFIACCPSTPSSTMYSNLLIWTLASPNLNSGKQAVANSLSEFHLPRGKAPFISLGMPVNHTGSTLAHVCKVCCSHLCLTMCPCTRIVESNWGATELWTNLRKVVLGDFGITSLKTVPQRSPEV